MYKILMNLFNFFYFLLQFIYNKWKTNFVPTRTLIHIYKCLKVRFLFKFMYLLLFIYSFIFSKWRIKFYCISLGRGYWKYLTDKHAYLALFQYFKLSYILEKTCVYYISINSLKTLISTCKKWFHVSSLFSLFNCK